MSHPRVYDDETIARILAAVTFGVSAKAIAYHTGISVETIYSWRARRVNYPVPEPDPDTREAFAALLRGITKRKSAAMSDDSDLQSQMTGEVPAQ